MGKSLTQSLTQFANHLTRKDGVYYYRRRLPERLGTDVELSLGTRRYREAEPLAEALDLMYVRAVSAVTSPTDLRAILRAYLEDALEDDTTMRLSARPRRPVYGGLVDEKRDVVDTDLETVAHVSQRCPRGSCGVQLQICS